MIKQNSSPYITVEQIASFICPLNHQVLLQNLNLHQDPFTGLKVHYSACERNSKCLWLHWISFFFTSETRENNSRFCQFCFLFVFVLNPHHQHQIVVKRCQNICADVSFTEVQRNLFMLTLQCFEFGLWCTFLTTGYQYCAQSYILHLQVELDTKGGNMMQIFYPTTRK